MTTLNASSPTRRGLLRAAGAGAGLAALTGLTACATSSGGNPAPATTTGADGDDPKNPFGAGDAELEVVVFDGGFATKYLDRTVEMVSEAQDGVTIEINRTQDLSALQTRFVGQDPPGLFQNSGAGSLDAQEMARNELLADLEDLMAAPSWDDPSVTVEESLSPASRLAGTMGNSLVGFNWVQYAWGLWHDANLFEAHGWQMPESWEDLMTLFGQIKAEGIAPLAFTGVHTYYPEDGLLKPLVAKFGGQDAWLAVDNLEEGAWHQDAIRDAAEALLQLRTDEFILPGVAQMTHTQSQTAWLNHEAAFIPVGAWLENEMRSAIPEDFVLTATSVPGPGGNLTDLVPNNAGAPWYVPVHADTAPAAKELLRAMVSKESARNFAELTSSLTMVKGAHEGQELGAALASIDEMVRLSDETEAWQPAQYSSWYPSLQEEVGAALVSLLVSDTSVDDFVNRCQARADEIASDDKIAKRTR